MIEFAPGVDEKEFYYDLHPEVRKVVLDLSHGLEVKFGTETVTKLTEVGRSNEASERIYLKIAERLLTSKGEKLTGVDLTQFQQIQFLSPMGLKQWALSRGSWHKPFAAVDIGMAHWAPEVRAFAAEWVHQHCEKPMWEVITESHGTGPHIHLARRDYVWLKEFPGSLRYAKGRRLPGEPLTT